MGRLLHALLGFIFGAILGGLCWFLYGLGFSQWLEGDGLHAPLSDWIKWGGGLFALLGLLFKEKAGSAVGEAFNGVYQAERRGVWDGPGWVAVLAVLAAAAAFWFFVLRG